MRFSSHITLLAVLGLAASSSHAAPQGEASSRRSLVEREPSTGDSINVAMAAGALAGADIDWKGMWNKAPCTTKGEMWVLMQPVNGYVSDVSPAMRDCYASFHNGPKNWADMTCSNATWTKHHQPGYNNADNCQEACNDCITGSISDGYAGASCINKVGGVRCRIEYNYSR